MTIEEMAKKIADLEERMQRQEKLTKTVCDLCQNSNCTCVKCQNCLKKKVLFGESYCPECKFVSERSIPIPYWMTKEQ